jgi:hypothetical protein
MKALILIFVLENLILFSTNQNQVHVANLSFDIIETNHETYKKIILKDSFTEFYIGSNLFRGATSSREEIIEEKLLNIHLIDICQFKAKANEIRENKLTQTRELGKIQVLFNHEIYDTIYIYFKEKDKIFRYKVNWIEQTD